MSGQRIIKGAAFLAMDGRRTIRQGDLMVSDGIIAAIGGVGPQAGAVVTETRGVLIPGLVQAHLHLSESLLGWHFVPDPDPFTFELTQLARRRRRRAPQTAEVGVRAGLTAALGFGATTCATVGEGAMVPAAAALGARVLVALDATSGDPGAALAAFEAAVASAGVQATVSAALWVGAAERAPIGRLVEAAKLATSRRLPLIAHAGTRPGDTSAIRRLDRARALGPHLVLCHGCGDALVDPAHVTALASAGASVIVTPSHDLIIGAQPPPVAALLDAEITVGLGSDSGATRSGLDPFVEVRLLAKMLAGDDTPASTALHIATRGGAAALELRTGSLAAGKVADLLVVDVPVNEIDDHEAVARRIIDGGASRIRTTWVAGEVVANHTQAVRAHGPSPAACATQQIVERDLDAEDRKRAGYWWARAKAAWLGRRPRPGWHRGRLF